jgi:hypothetical protein
MSTMIVSPGLACQCGESTCKAYAVSHQRLSGRAPRPSDATDRSPMRIGSSIQPSSQARMSRFPKFPPASVRSAVARSGRPSELPSR